jgi:hypothetical protein
MGWCVMKICVGFQWRDAGRVEIGPDGKLVFPELPGVPGIYRLLLRDRQGSSVYIGEAEDLKRRMQHYRTPGPRQLTNLRLHRRIQDVLEGVGAVEVGTATDATLHLNERPLPLDISKKAFRRLLESAALANALGNAGPDRVENL